MCIKLAFKGRGDAHSPFAHNRLFKRGFYLQSSIFLRCLVELECAGEHEVSWYAVVPCLGAPLCVHGVLFVGELVQDVEGGEFECEFFLEEGAGEFRVPHQVVGVHHVAAVSSSAEHLDVGGQ